MTKLPEYLEKMRDEACVEQVWTNGPGHCEGVAFINGFNLGAQAVLKEAEGLVEALNLISVRKEGFECDLYICVEVADSALKSWHEKFGKGEGDE